MYPHYESSHFHSIMMKMSTLYSTGKIRKYRKGERQGIMGIFKKKMTVIEAINKVRTTPDTYLIDCRTQEEYASGHISGAIHYPVEKITQERVLRRFPDKDSHFYIVGSYSQKASAAVKKFKKMGYKNVEVGGAMEEHHGRLVK